MTMLRPPAFHDIARIIGRDVIETEARLEQYYTDAFSAPFNYQRAVRLSRFALSRGVPLHSLLEGCNAEPTDQGKQSNAEVLSLLWHLSANRTVRTFELAPKPLAIRSDLRISVAPPFYFVEREQAYVYWLQPRKSYALDGDALALLASIVKSTFLVDDFRNVGFEVCDMSAPDPKLPREPRVFHLESFNIMSEEETQVKLQFFASAYDRLVARGIQRKKRPESRAPASATGLFSP